MSKIEVHAHQVRKGDQINIGGHIVKDRELYRATVRAGVRAAREAGLLPKAAQ